MRWLIPAVVGLSLAPAAAHAATTPLQLICGRYDAQWAAVRGGGDTAAKRRVIGAIPAQCPLRAQAERELARSLAAAAKPPPVAAARPPRPLRPSARAEDTADAPPPAARSDPGDSKMLDNLAASISGGGTATGHKPRQGPAPDDDTSLAGLLPPQQTPGPPPTKPPPAAPAAPPAPPATITVGGFPALTRGQLPPQPQLEPLPDIAVPASFCSVEAQIAFIEKVTTPAYLSARRNVVAVNAYGDWLNALSAQYESEGSGMQIPVVKAFKAYEPTMAETLAISNRYLKLDAAVRRVPIAECGGR
jgi:hypothetical protein